MKKNLSIIFMSLIPVSAIAQLDPDFSKPLELQTFGYLRS